MESNAVLKSKTSKWYLIYCKPREEKKAKKNLENQGFESFLPLISLIQKDGSSSDAEIMFPRYIFSKFSKEEVNWLTINSTLGVSKVVFFGDHLAEVPEKLIKEIKIKCGREGILKQSREFTAYRKGDKLVVKEGIFKDKSVIFLSYKGKERIRILLEIISQHAVAEISKSSVDKKFIVKSLKI